METMALMLALPWFAGGGPVACCECLLTPCPLKSYQAEALESDRVPTGAILSICES